MRERCVQSRYLPSASPRSRPTCHSPGGGERAAVEQHYHVNADNQRRGLRGTALGGSRDSHSASIAGRLAAGWGRGAVPQPGTAEGSSAPGSAGSPAGWSPSRQVRADCGGRAGRSRRLGCGFNRGRKVGGREAGKEGRSERASERASELGALRAPLLPVGPGYTQGTLQLSPLPRLF